ncbi:MAG: DNA recombination protein RmuC [Burkholderiaceae bacterium]|nr:DNA recombination protein RmuC [Burkholderiaceae bacterium]
MPEWIVLVVALALALNLLLLLWLVWRQAAARHDHRADDAAVRELERLERELRDELGRQGQGTRADLANFQQMLLTQSGDVARTQNDQIDSFRTQLAGMQQATEGLLRRVNDTLAEQLLKLAEANQRRFAEVRQAVDARLAALQEGNEKKLEQMRATVDEKLHATLEQRLGESFKQVADRLEQVHKGLGEMQGLARDVGSLNRVLTNVKTRGIVGEVQLAGLLEQVFTVEQYATNVETVPGSGARVEFAIRLPGRRDDGQPMWLPIDAKFPREDYERLLDAQERADAVALDAAARAIEARLRLEAKTIRDKYLAAPHTTDFAILFVPTEGLYAEALRRPGLVDALQREHRVTLAGPTTLLATLTSLQMGFRTLALEKRSTEVWEVLGAVKTEFDKFGRVLAKMKGQTQTVLNSISDAETRTRQMTRALKQVEALPEPRSQALLPGAAATDDDDDDTVSQPGHAGA